jgi:hypothetical protein
MKNKIAAFGLAVVTAGMFAWMRTHNAVPYDLRDAVADTAGFDTSIPVIDKSGGNVPEPQSIALSAGYRVIDARNIPGTVKEVFSNGTARIIFDKELGDRYLNVKELGAGTKCLDGVCKRSRVIDTRRGTGKVYEVFTNGVAKVMFDNELGYRYLNVKELGVGIKCYRDVCEKSRIIDTRRVTGKVYEVFTNGIAKVMFDDELGYRHLNIKDLGVGVDCYEGICVKNRVINSANVPGTVKEVFNNGMAKIMFDNELAYQNISIKELGTAAR